MMKLRSGRFAKCCGLLAAAFLLFSCSDDDQDTNGNADSFDRNAVLVNLADNIITPGYVKLGQSASELAARATDFQNDISMNNLAELRTAWLSTLTDWQAVGFYDIGPAFNQGLLGFMNQYPVDPDKIDLNIANGNFNLESASNIDATGLQALDYLLYGTGNNDAEIITYFTATPNAVQYVNQIATLINAKVSATVAGWQGDYRNTFVGASGTDIGSSLGQLINASIQYFERNIRDAKIGIPAGARTSTGTALPGQAECYYSNDFSKNQLLESVNAWQRMFNGNAADGTTGQGLDDYLSFLGTMYEEGMPLQEEINNRFELIKQKVNPLDPSIRTAVTTQQDQSLEVFDTMQPTVVLLKVDMTSAMGIQITYADNDGD